MTRRKRLPKGLRQYIRQEKARLSRQILDLKKQKKGIEEIYKRLGIKREDAVSLSPPKVVNPGGIAKKKIK